MKSQEGWGARRGRRRTGNTRNTCSAGFLSCRWFNSGHGVTIKYNFEAARRKLHAATSFDPLSFRVKRKKERKEERIYPIE